MRISLAFSLLLAAFLTACGPGGSTVTLRLQTGLESPGRFKNLMTGLASAAQAKLGPLTCRQRNLFAGLDLSTGGDDGEHLLDTFPIHLSSNYTTAGNYSIDALWLQSNTEFEPISIPVPRGVEVGLGIIGSFVTNGAIDSRGDCGDFDPTTQAAYNTYTFAGHRRWTATSTADVPLNVFVTRVDATPSPTPPAGSSGDLRCEDEASESQFCPTTNYYGISCTGAGCPSLQFKFEYGFGRNRAEHIVQWVQGMPVAGTFSLPDILPIRVSVYQASNHAVELDSHVFHKGDFINGTPRTAISPILFSSAQIKILERPRKLPDPLGSFNLGLAFDPGGTAILRWTQPQNARFGSTAYEIRSSSNSQSNVFPASTYYPNLLTTVSASQEFYLTALTPGLTYYFRVYASDGFTQSASSPEVVYTPIATPSFTTFSPASGSVTAYWNFPAGSVSAQNFLRVFVPGGTTPRVADIPATCSASCSATFNRPVGDAPGTHYDLQIVAGNNNNGKAISARSDVGVP